MEKKFLSPEEAVDAIYLKDALSSRGRYGDADEELRLAKRSNKGDAAARAILIESMCAFVYFVAKNYIGNGVPYADLVSTGMRGVIRAVDTFDPSRNLRLATYAGWHIHREIRQEAMRQGRVVKFGSCSKWGNMNLTRDRYRPKMDT